MVFGFRFVGLKICFCYLRQMLDSLCHANWKRGENPPKIKTFALSGRFECAIVRQLMAQP
jgi:hypothetical protein